GGETGVRKLVDRFYDLMDTSPEAADIRAIHPKSLKQSREKLFMFLTGWSGGPQLYIESRGHPALRMRHAPFSIGETESSQWEWCMHKALDEMEIDSAVHDYLKNHFSDATKFLRNR
ncbi:MAG TPA: group II truncated hemoglobin, partial [Anaerolineales bacterium]|nr:group II truncated hemoglobin [Anaerolineales bacterium]